VDGDDGELRSESDEGRLALGLPASAPLGWLAGWIAPAFNLQLFATPGGSSGCRAFQGATEGQ
jgi:hypothetical protein